MRIESTTWKLLEQSYVPFDCRYKGAGRKTEIPIHAKAWPWANLAKIRFTVLTNMRLKRRIGGEDTL